MKWTPRQIPRSPYSTIAEDTHFGRWQQTGGLCHDKRLLDLAVAHIVPGTTVIDVGAFNGDHAIAYARKAGLVWAFEPQLPAFLCLCTNVFMGMHGNVRPERVALGDDVGTVRFADWTGSLDNFGARTTVADGIDVVRLARLDDHPAAESGRVSYMKLDCEGHEMRVLRGAAALIERDKPAMLVEINDGMQRKSGSSEEELLTYLRGLGYHLKPIGGNFGNELYDVLCTR